MNLLALETPINAVRICGAMPPKKLYDEYGFGPDDMRSEHVSAAEQALDNIQYVFNNPTGVTRFSDGTYPVLYTSGSIETAVSEKGYWIINSVFSKKTKPRKVNCIQFNVNISGNYIDLSSEEYFNKELVHPNDYKKCHEIARDCIIERAEFIKTYSARRIDSVNFAIFQQCAVVNHQDFQEVYFFENPTGVSYKNNNSELIVEIHDVYSLL